MLLQDQCNTDSEEEPHVSDAEDPTQEVEEPAPDVILPGSAEPAEQHDFVKPPGPSKTLSQWKDLSDGVVIMKLAQPILLHTLKCTNKAILEDSPDKTPITWHQFQSFIGFRIACGIIPLTNMHDYFYPSTYQQYGFNFPNFATKLPYHLYAKIVKYMRFEDYDTDANNLADPAWKVRTITTMAQKAFRETDESPGRDLTVDEGMGKCEVARNPIFVHVPNKPVDEGFKWYMLVDSATKLCINFVLQDGTSTAAEYSAFPGKMRGYMAWQLVQHLEGRWHRLFFDNWFSSCALARWLYGQSFGSCGTALKDKVDVAVRFEGKKPKPSRANPKGTMKFAHSQDNVVHQIGFMDTGACYFIDTIWGTKHTVIMERKTKAGKDVPEPFEVAEGIAEYNKRMGGADTNNFYSIGPFSFERYRRAYKWTIRYFECVLSRLMAQAFIIGRVVNGSDKTRLEFQLGMYDLFFFNKLDSISTRPTKEHPGAPTPPPAALHVLGQTPVGSCNNYKNDNRRYRAKCVLCPNSQPDGTRNFNNTTTYYCTTCFVPLHPECAKQFCVHKDTRYAYVKPNPKFQQFYAQDN